MSNNNQIKKIVIVGGGSAGWMAASAFAKVLGQDYADISLIESANIGTVSVGEATIPQISLFNRILGIDENEFIRETQGTYKLGIDFVDWQKIGTRYFHPFGDHGLPLEGLPFHHFWLKQYQHDQSIDIEAFSLNALAAKQDKFMRPQDHGNSPLSNIRYAYHFDATLYAKFLSKYAIKRGVKRIEAKVEKVNLRSTDGYIESLKLDNGQIIEGDLFIDCTGFKGLLIEGALNTGFDNWSDLLPCDRAVAMPCMSKENLHPYTIATAQKVGWTWRIPLQHRVGNGYVYSSKYMSDDEAVNILKSQMENEPLAEPNFLRWQTGMRKKAWNKNCIAIGLSAGFVEPMESTGLHLIQSSIAKLMSLFPSKDFNQRNINTFNEQVAKELYDIRDFIVLHYAVTERNDSDFWLHCRNMDLPDTLKHKMAFYKETGKIFRLDNELFNETSWLAVMHGQGLRSEGYHPLVDCLPEQEIKRRLEHVKSVIDKSAEVMPDHAEFIRKNGM